MPVPGTVPFTLQEVEEMNTQELRAAYELRFGRPLLSGNLPYARRILQRVCDTDAPS